MTEYKIIKVGEDFYVAHEDFRREAWRTDLLLGNSTVATEKNIVERDGYFIEPYAEVGNVKFRFGPSENDNHVSIDGAGDVRLPWHQASHLLSNLREKADRDKRTSFEEGRKQRLEHAAKTGEVTAPDGD